MNFSEILSQKSATHHLQSMLKTGRIPPALIFLGPAGCGKYPAAIAFSAALNCTKIPYIEKAKKKTLPKISDDLFSSIEEPEQHELPEEENIPEKLNIPPWESCGKCLSCIQIKNNAHPDIIITGLEDQLEKTGKESANLKIDTMREMIKKAYQKPFISPHKVFIVRDAEKLLPEAQNSLLKTLEDPPEGTIICLLASDKNSLLPTILSRAAIVKFSPLSEEAMKILLKKEGFPSDDLEFFSKNSLGSLDKARKIKIFRDRSRMLNNDRSRIFQFASMLPKDSHKAREETNAFLELMAYRQREIWKNTPGKQHSYAKLIKEVMELRSLTRRNVSSSRILEAALLSCEEAGITIDQLLGE